MLSQVRSKPQDNSNIMGADIAQWLSLHIPSCVPWFNPQAKHLELFNLYLNCHEESMKIDQKRPGMAHSFKKTGKSFYPLTLVLWL